MKPCVIIPSYNSGPLLLRTLREVLPSGEEILVVIDGSTDGSDDCLEALAAPSLRILRLPVNRGKGAAVLAGLELAAAGNATHALVMDADGQHPASHIPIFMEAARLNPNALILGKPIFDSSAPAIRVNGRKISNFWTNLETLWSGIGDSLFGMRLYPIEPLRRVFSRTRFARRFDFEPEAAVRLSWQGLPIINIPTPVKYLSADEGGISQFRYLRDNTLLTFMHLRLVIGAFIRLPLLISYKFSKSSRSAS